MAIEMNDCTDRANYFDEEFAECFSQVFNNFHQLFMQNGDNSFFAGPLDTLISIGTTVTMQSLSFTEIFRRNHCIAVILDILFYNSKFSTDNILQEIFDRKSDSSYNNFLDFSFLCSQS